jgi:CPA2 family monovalent cation:H+ antiporter-2
MVNLPDNVLLRDLAMVMIVAGVVTLLFHRLRQPVVLGYILAGIIIGPHTPPFPLVANQDSIRTLADLGVVFLMFSLGLQFSLRTLKEVGTTAFVASALEIVVLLGVGYRLGQFFGWSKMDSLFLGAMLSITSTTIIVKTLTELGMLKAKFAQLTFGIQIVEDTLGMTMIAVLSGLALTGAVELPPLAGAVGRVTVFLAVVLVAGLILVPPLLRYVARFKSDEMLLITVLALCFGVTLAGVKLGHSVALGAFLIGTIIGEAREIGRIKVLLEPVRDMFSAVFFVTIGLLINPALLLQQTGPILLISAVVIVGKTAAFSVGTFVTGHDLRTSLKVGTCMVPIGELSFIIASLGLTLQVTSDFLYPIAVCVSAITMPLTPYMVRKSDAIIHGLNRVAPRGLVTFLETYSRWLERFRGERPDSLARRLLRKWLWQMALNVALSSGAFMAAAALAEPVARRWPDLPAAIGGARGALWLGAALVALPSLIAVVRKLQAFAMLVGEASVTAAAAGRHTATIRAVLTNTIFLGGVGVLGMWILVLSAALLPSGWALVVLLLIIGVLTILLWRYFIKLHARGQNALREVFLQTTPPPVEVEAPLHAILKDVQLARVTIGPSSSAARKLIREVGLRTQTGASVVGIQRLGASIINPGPDEELLPGDTLVLLGSETQLQAARELVTGPASPAA